MTKKELLKQLKGIPDNTEVIIQFSYFDCSGHESGEYCYCSNSEKICKDFGFLFEKSKKEDKITKVVLTAE